MVKKLIISIIAFFIILGLFVWTNPTKAQDANQEKIKIHFFWGKGCPHCASEKPFLEKMRAKYPQIEIVDYEVWYSQNNLDLLKKVGTQLNASVSGVPFTVIGKNYVSGWLNEEATGAKIEEDIKCAIDTKCPDVVDNVKNSQDSSTNANGIGKPIPAKIKVPIFGEINLKNLSLPALTVILGTVDGFNPCAMWALIFLLGLLIEIGDQRKIRILGSAFLIASAFIYFLFMSAWLNLLFFIGMIIWVRLAIGIVALIFGSLNLKEYFTVAKPTCKVTKGKKQQKIFAKLKEYVHHESFWFALGGIIILAFAVNLVEAICSLGIPAIYTQILTLSKLSHWQYYGYIFIYIIFYMLDDIIIFLIAIFTMKFIYHSAKYTKISQLVGGLAMVVIGILLLIKPEWLMFG